MKKDYAEEVAARIIEQLSQGTAPWQKPWKPGELRTPYNPTTGKEYQGFNSLWLSMQGRSDPRWLTYNQAADAGAQVRKGSKGTVIVYWKFREERKQVDAAGNPVLDENGKQKTITVELERPRSFSAVVFNAEQIDGLPPLEAKTTAPEPERHARAETVLANSGAVINHIEGDRAFYRPSTDSITLPLRNQFHSADSYYATALHELGHWTGHPTRLDRDLGHPFGSEGYAREELRAEIASLMIGEKLEIGHDPGQHVAYVGSWIKALQEDPKEIFRAASDAQKIANMVMGFELEQMKMQTVESQQQPEQQPAPVPVAWRYEACRVFDEEMAVATGNPDYDRARRLARELNHYEEMSFEPSPEEQALLAERKPDLDEAAQWIHENVLLNPVVKERVYETVRDLGRDTGDPAIDKERHDYLAEMEAKQKVSPAERDDAPAQSVPSQEKEQVNKPEFSFDSFVIGVTDKLDGPRRILSKHQYLDEAVDALKEVNPTLAPQLYLKPSEDRTFDRRITQRPDFNEPATRFDPAHSPLVYGDWIGETHQFVSIVPGMTEMLAAEPGSSRETLETTAMRGIEAYANTYYKGMEPAQQQPAPDFVVQSAQPLVSHEAPTTQHEEDWLLSQIERGTMERVLQKATPVQIERMQGVLDQMLPLNTQNEFWSRHPLPDDVDALDAKIVTALESVENAAGRQQAPEADEKPDLPIARTYLAVPFKEKDEAKKLGAKWDKDAKAWYAPEGVDLAKSGLARWSDNGPNVVKVEPNKERPEREFANAIRAAGLELDGDAIMDGEIHRCKIAGDKGSERSGAYAGHLKGVTPGGYIQNHRTGEVINWRPEGAVEALTPEQKAAAAAEAAQDRANREAATAQQHAATKAAAYALWNEAPEATEKNAYCKIKGITNPGALGLREVPATVSPETAALGIKIAKTAPEAKAMRAADPEARVFKAGDLLIALRDTDGEIWSLQSVNPYFKSFMKEGRKHGLFTVAGLPEGVQQKDAMRALAADSSPLVFAEGFATSVAINRAIGQPVVVTFDSGNLSSVIREVGAKLPEKQKLIGADNDHEAPLKIQSNGKPGVNVGMEKAKAAAKEHGAGVFAPQFKEADKGLSDWDDYERAHGSDAMRRHLAEQLAVAKVEAGITAERITTLARERDAEARNDPTTSADDAMVASERAKAAELMANSTAQASEIKSKVADGLVGDPKATRSQSATLAGVERSAAKMKETEKQERETVLHHADDTATEVSWKNLPKEVRQAKEQAVREGRDVALPNDAPAKLRKLAGLETPKPRRSAGLDAGL